MPSSRQRRSESDPSKKCSESIALVAGAHSSSKTNKVRVRVLSWIVLLDLLGSSMISKLSIVKFTSFCDVYEWAFMHELRIIQAEL